jgi:hypothetical protein
MCQFQTIKNAHNQKRKVLIKQKKKRKVLNGQKKKRIALSDKEKSKGNELQALKARQRDRIIKLATDGFLMINK